MSRHLRPTSPQPPDRFPSILIEGRELERVVRLDPDGVTLYVRVLARAQLRRPCTIESLWAAFPEDAEAMARAACALVQAQILTWVEEDEEGGAV